MDKAFFRNTLALRKIGFINYFELQNTRLPRITIGIKMINLTISSLDGILHKQRKGIAGRSNVEYRPSGIEKCYAPVRRISDLTGQGRGIKAE
jgi:hypothetical protein